MPSNKNVLIGALVLTAITTSAIAQWKPAEGRLKTRWADRLTPENAWRQYPRPQLRREQWQNLNGLWDHAIRPADGDRPTTWDGTILVPFCVESALSGVMKPVGPEHRLWYRRRFELAPAGHAGARWMLHFGAVDWHAMVWVNGRPVGEHKGGYDPFHFDITDALVPGGQQEVIVSAWDPTDAGDQPRGKQVRQPRGIWYTSVTGIWQTVWLEPVPATRIARLKITPDVDAGAVQVLAVTAGDADGRQVTAVVTDHDRVVARATGKPDQPITVTIPDAVLWSPDTPHLYDLKVSLTGRADSDVVDSYFGMRKIAVAKDNAGVNRLMLNGEALFQYGTLDQGWWPDGLYLPASDAALQYDVSMTKRLGFNMARKHVKIEPARWYYWCDRLGLLVWQDMPSGDKYIGRGDPDITRSAASARNFETELRAMVDTFFNHPSIVMWVPYNEGWGQWETTRICELLERWDPTRLVNNASGWTDRRSGDVNDIHRYPGPGMPALEDNRAAVLGEFGGLGLPVKEHTWQDKKNWGYRSFGDRDALTEAYVRLLHDLRPLIGKGLAAAVYTQTSDVEIEVNGLMTYDRAMVKPDAARAAEAARKLYLPPPIVETIVATAQHAEALWRYTTTAPAAGWERPAFDDAGWRQGRAGFGEPDTPGAVVRTRWKTDQIWLRRSVELSQTPTRDVHLMIHHDEDAVVYLNGVLAAELSGYSTDYGTAPLRDAAKATLQRGVNVIAMHCRQTGGGQYIDAGLVQVTERER